MITTYETAPTVAPIPKPINEAVCKVQCNIHGAIKKSQRNLHGGYNFASTDDIYAGTMKIMGEVGLSVLCLEDKCEIVRIEKDGKIVQWANMVFSFVLAAGGETWADPRLRRTLYIQVTGPQTFQAAQSYAEKAFLRSLFKLATGDMDLDAMPQSETEEGQMDLAQPRKKKSSSAAKKDGSDKLFNEVRDAIRTASNPDELREVRDRYAQEWAEMPTKWEALLNDEYEDKILGFGMTLEPAE